MVKLALSGFLFEDNYSTQSVEFEDFCRIAASAGYQGVELRKTQVSINTSKERRMEILRIVNQYNLEVTCLTARNLPISGMEREKVFNDYLELCCDLKCKLLKISGEISWLRQAAEKASQYNVVLAVNNHVGGLLETVQGTREFFKKVDHPNIRLLFDPFHLMVNNENYIECIPEFSAITANILMQSARQASVNEKDVFMVKDRYWKKALPHEEGVQDWKRIFESFKKCNYNGFITVIENSWSEDKREYVAKCCSDFIRKESGML